MLIFKVVRDAKQTDRITRCLVGVLVAPRLQVAALLSNTDYLVVMPTCNSRLYSDQMHS
jgi:hypothetical protein